MDIQVISPHLYDISNGDNRFLGLGLGSSRASGAHFLQVIRASEGQLVTPDGLEPWKVQGCTTFNGELIAYGPWLENAQFLDRAVLEGPIDAGLAILRRFAEIMPQLRTAGFIPGQGFNPLLFINSDKGIFCLPPAVGERLLSTLQNDEREHAVEPYRTPLHNKESAFSWGFATFVDRLLTGTWATAALPGVSTIVRRIAGDYDTPEARGVTLPLAITLLLSQALSVGKEPSDEDWKKALADVPLPYSIQAVEPALQQKAQQLHKNKTKHLQRKEFFRKYSGRIAIVSVSILVLLAIPLSMLGNIFRTPKTTGLEAEAVVRGVFSAATSLDREYFTDAFVSASKYPLFGQIDIMTMVSKVRAATENQTVLITPAQWKKLGSRTLNGALLMFGADQVRVEAQGAPTSTHAVFLATYDWYDSRTMPGARLGGTYLPEPTVITERFILDKKDKRWYITSYERLGALAPSSKPVTTPTPSPKTVKR